MTLWSQISRFPFHIREMVGFPYLCSKGCASRSMLSPFFSLQMGLPQKHYFFLRAKNGPFRLVFYNCISANKYLFHYNGSCLISSKKEPEILLDRFSSYMRIWVLLCVFKLLCFVNLLSHFVHLNGFSPVWFLPCIVKVSAREKPLSHLVHLNGFSPV